MKTIMVLGAGLLQIPAIRAAQRRGLRVVAIDMDSQAVGFALADIAIAISTTDEASVLAVARKHAVDGVLTLATDLPVRTAAVVSETLGLPGPTLETAQICTHKGRLRERLAASGVAGPRFYTCASLEEYLVALRRIGGPAIVKPVDSSGSRGVSKVDSNDETVLQAMFERSVEFSGSKEVVVEDLMTGPELSVEVVAVGGSVHVLALTDKLTTGAPFFVEMGHTQPSNLEPPTRRAVAELAREAVEAVGIKNGAAHVEVMVTSEGPKVVELGARLGGDFIASHLVPTSTGIDLLGATIDLALGQTPRLGDSTGRAAAIRYLRSAPGVVAQVAGLQEAHGLSAIVEARVYVAPGDRVDAIESSRDRVGHVITDGATREEAVSACLDATDRIKVTLASVED